MGPALQSVIGKRCVGEGLCPSRSVDGNAIGRTFVGADDSVGPNDDHTISNRAGRVARPYTCLPYSLRFIVRAG